MSDWTPTQPPPGDEQEQFFQGQQGFAPPPGPYSPAQPGPGFEDDGDFFTPARRMGAQSARPAQPPQAAVQPPYQGPLDAA